MAGWTLLTSTLVEGSDTSFTWATSGVAAGNIYICGVIQDGHSPARYAVSPSYLKIDAPPTLSITAPAVGGATVAPGSTFAVQLISADSDDTVATALYYSATNAGCGAGLAGWTQIAANLSVSITSQNWNTTGVSPGSYFICGTINDGVNGIVYALSPGPVTVQSPLPPLSGQWHFNETSGTTVADSSGNGNNGTFGSGVTLNANGCQCVTFDKISSINIANPVGLPLGDSPYAITVWIKPDVATGTLGITGWGSYGASGSTSAFRTASMTGLTNYWFGPDIEYTGPSVLTLQDGNWHFVAAQYDGTKRSLWYDGTKVDEDTPGPGNFDASIFKIGETYPTLEYFKGSMDELTIYRGALTAPQMAAFYAAGRN